MSANTNRLNQPFPALGSARTYFFNGRLLAAEDLSREQTLRETGQKQLARIIGCGIERGLNVQGQVGNSLLQITGGLGIAPSGWICEVDGFDVDLSSAGTANRGRGFTNCAAAFGDLKAPNAGFYLLVLSPAWIADGRAPTLLGEVGICNRNTEQPAVRARLVPLVVTVAANTPLSTVRNQLAFSLLAPNEGSAAGLAGWWPKAVAPTLAEDDLPLAALQIDSQAKLVFLDVYSARRRLAPPPGRERDALWPVSRAVEMEAFSQQFIAQVTEKLSGSPSQYRFNPLVPSEYQKLPAFAVLAPAEKTRFEAFFPNLSYVYPFTREYFASDLDLGLESALLDYSANLGFYLYVLNNADGSPNRYLLRLQKRAYD